MKRSRLGVLRALARPAPEGARAGPRRVIGAVVGVLLLAAAIWAVASQGEVLGQAWDALRGAPALLVVGAFALPIVSWVATSLTFWVLSGRYAPVPASDMTYLIGAAWLLNHLPFRPGMVGRVAFHKKYHGMPIGDAVRVMVTALALTGVSLAMLLAVAIGVSRMRSTTAQVVCLVAPTLVLACAAVLARAGAWAWWRELAGLSLRSLDMLAWLGRYTIAFMLVGEPLSVEHVVAITAVCQAAMLVPVTGNGLGLREWVVGLTLAAVSAPGAREEAATIGLAADLVNRAAETLLAVPIGLFCSYMLARKVRSRGAPG